MKITIKRWAREKDPFYRVRVYADGELIIWKYQSSAHAHKWYVSGVNARPPAKTLKEALTVWRLLQ